MRSRKWLLVMVVGLLPVGLGSLLAVAPGVLPSKKFKVTFTVTYNEMTLAEAAAKEAVFRELYKDACKVDVRVEECEAAWLEGWFYSEPLTTEVDPNDDIISWGGTTTEIDPNLLDYCTIE